MPQSLGLVESLLSIAGLNWRVPDLSTVCRLQMALRLQLPYGARLVDSTRIKFSGEVESTRGRVLAAVAQGAPGIDAHKLEIRAIEVTDHSVGDAPKLTELLWQILLRR